MPTKHGSAARWPTVRLCATLTFDGKFLPLTACAASPAWKQLRADLCARSDAVLVGVSSPSIPEGSPAELPGVWMSLGPKTDLFSFFENLRALHFFKNVLCLGGAREFRALLKHDLVDELYLLIRPQVGGSRSQPTLTGLPGEFFSRSIRWRLHCLEVIDGECRLEYRRDRPAA